jgi:hypothetical protein
MRGRVYFLKVVTGHRHGELKFAAARSSVTPLPLNKLAASFVNRFRAVT